MLIGENIIMALNSIISNKMRSLLTMLGIIIGIGAVIAIFTVGDSMSQSIESNLQGMGSNDIFVTLKEKSEDTNSLTIDGVEFAADDSDYEKTESDYITTEMINELVDRYGDDIYAINISEQIGQGSAGKAGKTASINIVGASAGFFTTTPVEIQTGSMFSADDYDMDRMVCMVEPGLVDKLFGGDASEAVGSEISVSLDGTTESVTIVGVYGSENDMYGSMFASFFGDSTTLYMPLRSAMSMNHTVGQYTSLRVSAAVGADTSKLCGNVSDFFDAYYRYNNHFEVSTYTYDMMMNMLDSLLGTLTMAISIIAGIALIVGGIGVMNIMLVSVTERTREIGTRKALGAPNSAIRTQFIIEAMIICLIGGIIGLILGIVGGIFASNYMGYPAIPSVKGIIISLAFSISIGLFFGYFPANKAAQMNPIDALRYE